MRLVRGSHLLLLWCQTSCSCRPSPCSAVFRDLCTAMLISANSRVYHTAVSLKKTSPALSFAQSSCLPWPTLQEALHAAYAPAFEWLEVHTSMRLSILATYLMSKFVAMEVMIVNLSAAWKRLRSLLGARSGFELSSEGRGGRCCVFAVI